MFKDVLHFNSILQTLSQTLLSGKSVRSKESIMKTEGQLGCVSKGRSIVGRCSDPFKIVLATDCIETVH